jgi:glycosyltransferase involved in cell wall biosynthesis
MPDNPMANTHSQRWSGAIRLAIFTSHPIQYQAPWFRALSAVPDLDLRVFFSYIPNPEQQGVGFGMAFAWDVPVLEGYNWEVLSRSESSQGAAAILKGAARGLNKTIRNFNPDVVLILGWHHHSLIQVLLTCRFLNIPIVLRGESNGLRKRPFYKRMMHSLLFSQCQAFLAIGLANAAFYESSRVKKESIFMARYFVDNEWFLARYKDYYPARNELRAAWGLKPDSICFCFVGKLEPKKRIQDFIEALRIACGKNDEITGLIVGSGMLFQEAEAQVKRDNLPITFAGFLNQSEIPKAYVCADAIILPSDYGETWGLVINEAMVFGLPALVSDRVGCAHDLVVDGETGFVFPFGEAGELASCMLSLANNRDLMRDMGSRARSRVLLTYSMAEAVENTMKAVEYVRARDCADMESAGIKISDKPIR